MNAIEINNQKKIKKSITALSLLTSLIMMSCGSAQHNNKNAPLIIAEQGSFMVGGKVLTHPGTFNADDNFAPDGQTLHGDHAYVFYQKPVDARRYPIVFAHGYGQFGKTWETTPDGREGFQNIFLRRGFSVYIADQPRRGRAGRSTEDITITPEFDEQLWFNRFRVGVWPNYFDGVQFNRKEEILNQLYRQITPTTGPFSLDVYADSYAALFDKIGLTLFVTHSQGGPVGWKTLLRTDNIKAIAAYEPGGDLPFLEGTRTSDVMTLTGNPEALEVP